MDEVKVGIVVVSDRASKQEYKDKSGPEVEVYVKERIKNTTIVEYVVVPDDHSLIKQALIEMCDKLNCHLVLTSGGTGPAPRDITPDVTRLVISRELPGFGEIMRTESLKYVNTAILSRQTAGIRGKSLVINLPGSPKAIRQCLDAIFDAVPDCIKLISGTVVEFKGNSSKIYH